ncbi:MAG: Si-specific NAD(P)(+) transhydrogenase, partial [Desulfobacterales bacterium]|nr:Si-specific NAD(P)(+) transhydrogenase [Desulfobacterales bacterium]
DQLTRNGVEVVSGEAAFIDSHRIWTVAPAGESRELEADKILIATGTRPLRSAGFPFDDEKVVDSDGVLKLTRIPQSMIVVGGGVIGVEYASIFSVLGVEVTVVDGREALLDFLDREIVDEFVHCLRARGVVFRLGETVKGVERNTKGRMVARLESGKRLHADLVLVAAGRTGNTEALQLDRSGLTADERRRIPVNASFQTAVPHIYAAGDVIGFPSLASTSMEQGRLAASHAFDHPASATQAHFPFGIYGIPEMSMVGLPEQELTEKKIPYEFGVARLRETAKGQIMGIQDGMLKLLVGQDDLEVLGAHIIGEGASELIHIGQATLVLGGTLHYYLDTVFNYPTLAEAYKIAALDAWNRLAP